MDIILVKKKKNHIITVVFQDNTMYVRTLLGVQKRPKLEKKGVFLAILTSFGKEMMDKLRKTHAKIGI